MEKKRKQEELELEAKNFFNHIKKEIIDATRTGEHVVHVSFPKLSQFSPNLADNIIEMPEETIALLENELEQSGLIKTPRVRMIDMPQSTFVKIRNIRAKHLDQFLWIEGIIRQSSDVKPQVVNARFECPSCGAILSVLQIDRKFREPTRCSCNWKGNFKLLSKEMVDVQRLVIEESPDSLDGGEQPRRLTVFLKEDLVDPKMEKHSTPGSKIRIFGVLKEVPVPLPTGISTRFDIALDANNTIALEESFDELEINDEDIKEILELAANPNVFKKLSQSIAPSVYGFERIKESLLLQIFGGVKKKKSDGGSTRGDIHVLLVGDPGVAKSVMLKFISSIAPKGRYVSGKAATGAGLCVSPNSLVMTNPGGMQSIENLVENRLERGREYSLGVWKKDDIKDVKIQSLSDDLKIQSKYPKSIWKLKSPQSVYNIKLSSGKKIELTGNTMLLSLLNGKTEWKKSMKIKIGDYIATPRNLIGGEERESYTVDLIKSNPVVHGIKPFIKQIMEKLKEKYSSLRIASEKLNIRENQLYHHWVNKNARGNIKLRDLKKIAEEANINWKENVNLVSLYNGKNHKIPKYLDRDVLYLAGLIAGDGDIGESKSKSYSVRLSNSNEEIQNKYGEILKEKFGLRYDVQKGNEKRPQATRTSSKLLGEILIGLGVPVSPKSNKNPSRRVGRGIFIPPTGNDDRGRAVQVLNPVVGNKIYLSNVLLHLSNELLSEYIAGLYDSDGSVYVRKGKGSNSVELTSCSEMLVRQLQLALLRFGIHAKLRERSPSVGKIKGKYNRFILEIYDLSQIRLFAQQIPLKHSEKKRKIMELASSEKLSKTNIDIIPGAGQIIREIAEERGISLKKIGWHNNLSRGGLQKILSKINLKDKRIEELKKLANSDIFWERVISVEENNPKYEYVYDLTVEDSHNFVVDGVLVHNTAAVVKDEFLKGWSLEAGAMVLSNKGLVAIDEIEKMGENDRSTMHESMEQQTVTISKANIQATLRSETTVLAAGNPKLGRFDPYTPIPQQIDISPALLSRFDIIFIIRDLPNKIQDEAIASHVLAEHKQEVIRDVVESRLMRKYIAYAKQKIKPKLTDEAIEEIKTFYVMLRNQSTKGDSDIKPIPMTARQLEGIIRLSEAHAKLHLKDKVTREDAKRAIEILKISLSQVGYDEETQSFDIDRMTTGITSSKRSKIIILKETISQLESKMGKLIPIEELEKALENKLTPIEMEEAMEQLSKMGDIFKPKKGFIQRI